MMERQNQGASPTLIDTGIRLLPQGQRINMYKPVCRDGNRLYLPLRVFVHACGGMLKPSGEQLYIKLPRRAGRYIDQSNTKASIFHNDIYLPLFEFCRLFSAITIWDREKNAISMYFETDNISATPQTKGGRPALIRFEDLSAGGSYLESRNLEKLRLIGSFLYASAIPFQIAWIPRFIDPPQQIDNDISKDYSFINAEFLFSLDHLLSCGGLLGLHGYTHQYGDEVSGEGTEFSTERNHTETEIRERVEAAIATANRCSLPYYFFESPHYASDAFQQSIFEEYFDIIYEAFVGIWGDKVVLSPRNHRTLYIPTPLGYMEGENGLEDLLKRIRDIDDQALASMFYHVYLEFDFIERKDSADGYPMYTYRRDSPLHQILDAFAEKGCTLVPVTQMHANE